MLARTANWRAGFMASRWARPFSAKACSRVARDASKVALVQLVEMLQRGRLPPARHPVPHRRIWRSFGAYEIPREDYLARLHTAIAHDAIWPGI